MNIQGLDYNTQREILPLPEYGREIQKMVEHAISLPSREERMSCAKTIVRTMEMKVPQVRVSSNYQQTLWDHLYLMSRGQLDIDWPYDVSDAGNIHSKPQSMRVPQGNIRQRHYGRLVENLLEKLKDMPEGPERDALAHQTACQMKRDLLQWGHGTTDDERVAADMAFFTDGRIQIDVSKKKLPTSFVSTDGNKRSGKKKK